MDRLVWNAALRVALLVGCGLSVVAALLVADALAGRRSVVADASGIAAASLAAAAIVALLRARGFFARPDAAPSSRARPYRDSASTAREERVGADGARATRRAAWALIALSFAAAFMVVAAASRR